MANVQLSTRSAAVKTAYEANANTNAFTDDEKSKLAGIEAGAQVNPTLLSQLLNDTGFITSLQAPVQSVAGQTGDIILDAGDITDFDMAADLRISAQKGFADGLAPLDGSGKIPVQFIPGSIDDVLEYTDLASFPATGESGKIYIALDTNRTYRWGSTVYVEISPSAVLSVNGMAGAVNLSTSDIPEAANLYFTNARARSAAVLNTLAGSQTDQAPSVAATKTALDAKANSVAMINTQTANYILAAADMGNIVEMNLAGANTLTVPPDASVPIPIGSQVIITQLGAGQTTIVAGDGVTIRTAETLVLAKQYASVLLYKRGTNEWILTGYVEAA